MTQQQHHREVDQTERQLESGRPGARRGDRGEEDLRDRRVDRLQVGMVDARPGRVAKRGQLRGVGRVGIGMNAVPLHPAVPDVALNVVGQSRWAQSGDQPEQQGRPQGPAQRPWLPGDRPVGDPHRQREQPVGAQKQREVRPQVAETGQQDVDPARQDGERQDTAGNLAPAGGVFGIRAIHGRPRVTVGAV